MQITKEQLKRIISETIDEMRIDTPIGYPRNQGKSVPKDTPREKAKKVENAILNTEGWQNQLPSQAWRELHYDQRLGEEDIKSVLEFNYDAEMHEFIKAMLAEA